MKSSSTSGNGGTPHGGPKGPIVDRLTKPLPKRFYKDVAVTESGTGTFAIALDGRPLKTPAKRPFALPTRAAAEAVAAEWAAQAKEIDPAAMPMTRFTNTALDAVAGALADVASDIVAFAGRDLVCYRAEGPEALKRKQAAAWDPVLDWCASGLGAAFETTEGVMPVDQAKSSLVKIAAALAPLDAFRLTPLHVMTTMTGSALLALAHTRGLLSSEAAWVAAHIDEDYQIALWGRDEEAEHRRKARTGEFYAASTYYALVSSDREAG